MTGDEAVHADLLDVALRDEIELVSDLVVAASSSPRHFTPEEIDALLGLRPKGNVTDSTPQAESEGPGPK